MAKDLVHLNSIVHANPCTEDWDGMPGDEWTRHCDKCGQNVYNLSAMTAREAEALLASHEGRVCTKLYRRSDGSVLTQRCPSSIRKRLLRISKWAATAGFAIPALAHDGWACPRGTATITRSVSNEELSTIQGVIVDVLGDCIPGVEVTLHQQADEAHCVAVTGQDGRFRFPGVEPGAHVLSTEAEGFANFREANVAVAGYEALDCRIEIHVGSLGGNA